jgi:hypothetical protein
VTEQRLPDNVHAVDASVAVKWVLRLAHEPHEPHEPHVQRTLDDYYAGRIYLLGPPRGCRR